MRWGTGSECSSFLSPNMTLADDNNFDNHDVALVAHRSSSNSPSSLSHRLALTHQSYNHYSAVTADNAQSNVRVFSVSSLALRLNVSPCWCIPRCLPISLDVLRFVYVSEHLQCTNNSISQSARDFAHALGINISKLRGLNCQTRWNVRARCVAHIHNLMVCPFTNP